MMYLFLREVGGWEIIFKRCIQDRKKEGLFLFPLLRPGFDNFMTSPPSSGEKATIPFLKFFIAGSTFLSTGEEIENTQGYYY